MPQNYLNVRDISVVRNPSGEGWIITCKRRDDDTPMYWFADPIGGAIFSLVNKTVFNTKSAAEVVVANMKAATFKEDGSTTDALQVKTQEDIDKAQGVLALLKLRFMQVEILESRVAKLTADLTESKQQLVDLRQDIEKTKFTIVRG